MNHNDAERLTHQVARLPPERQIEVVDFVEFLLRGEQPARQSQEAREWQNLMLAQTGSLADWDNAEDEVWNNVPAV
uniref:DUF2281 domain-containing protein n=1 Tax=Candidatus Kentrum sp. DK TaxID=2126562 RepID=A0A450S0V8_9GAMM|nr:MAG: Protein of unknown function (DUF2281) [Candidatus Kentron sp. DK]VFJ56934.1 MAG: Protein of unknown function (DUF2281) [Candidatus Kentron sp. DK]